MAAGAARIRAQRMARGLVMERSWPGWSECCWRGSSMTIAGIGERANSRPRTPPARSIRSAGDGRADELHAVGACPLGGSGHGAELAAAAVDDQRRRHAEGLARGFELLKHFRARVGIIGEVLDVDAPEKRPRLVGIAGVDID